MDSRDDLPLPKTSYFAFLDLSQKDSIQKIIRTVKEMKKEMDKRLPDAFRKKKR